MPRKAYPRPAHRHESTALAILNRHAQVMGVQPSLPIPIEMIVEQTFQLEVVYDTINDESGDAGGAILGALIPSARRIILNVAYEDLFDNVIGPERFTLAHELAHWAYDADNPDQLSFAFDVGDDPVFCYHRGSPNLADDLRVREINANKLAAALLMPAPLLRAANIPRSDTERRRTASAWGLSYQAFTIRLDELGL